MVEKTCTDSDGRAAPPLSDEFLIQAHPIGQDHVSKGALVLVEAVGLEGDFLPEDEVRGGVLGLLAVGLAFLRAIDPAEAYAFRALAVKNFDGVAVEDGDDSASEIGGEYKIESREYQREHYDPTVHE